MLEAGKETWADEELLLSVKKGKGMMPAYDWLFSDEDILKVIKYWYKVRASGRGLVPMISAGFQSGITPYTVLDP